MTSPNNMQSLALNHSEKEHSRNSTSNTDDDDEMPAITNAMYIAELKQHHADAEQRSAQRNVDLEQQIANLVQRHADVEQRNAQRNIDLQKQHYNQTYLTMILVFSAFLVVCVLNAKK